MFLASNTWCGLKGEENDERVGRGEMKIGLVAIFEGMASRFGNSGQRAIEGEIEDERLKGEERETRENGQ